MAESVEFEVKVTRLSQDESLRKGASSDSEDPDDLITYFEVDLESDQIHSVRYGGRHTVGLVDKLTDATLGKRYKVTITPVE